MVVSEAVLADILSISKRNIETKIKKGQIKSSYDRNCKKYFKLEDLKDFPVIKEITSSPWKSEIGIKPIRTFTSVELFAGAGGLALGLEKAGFKHLLFNEIDKNAALTIHRNTKGSTFETDLCVINETVEHLSIDSPLVANANISELNFKPLRGKVDLLSGGFPCQAFSYAGQKRGFDDIRGTLFFEFARAIKELNPPVFLAENVRGLLNHDDGRTLATIKNVVRELGYVLIDPKVLKAIFHRVPQKRERLILFGIRNDLVDKFGVQDFNWPAPCSDVFTLKDALCEGELYSSDVPKSEGQKYPKRKEEIMRFVPPGGYWRDLPDELQIEYMKGSYYLGGGKTGMARRLSWDEPSLTLTTSPAQKQTERCHPKFDRPLTYREYARIQTFPDYWEFEGSLTSKYKQIGNAVPVNLAERIGNSVVRYLNFINQNADI